MHAQAVRSASPSESWAFVFRNKNAASQHKCVGMITNIINIKIVTTISSYQQLY